MLTAVEVPVPGMAAQRIIKARAIFRGTMVTTDLVAARCFYEEFLGLECVRIAADRMLIRMPAPAGGPPRKTGEYCLIDVRQVASITHPQNVLNHWGIDVPTRADVDRIHAAAVKHKEKYGLRKIMNVRMQHGVYAFYFADRDYNWWEIEERGEGTWAAIFEPGDRYPD